MKKEITIEKLDEYLDYLLDGIGAQKEGLSNFQKRQCVFNYLVKTKEYDFELLNNMYSYKGRDYDNEILSVLKPSISKGVCNSFSYVYKLLLNKLDIPSVITSCNVVQDSVQDFIDEGVNTTNLRKDETGKYKIPHMLILVQNDDGTFSFDDVTYGIFNKGTEKEQEFFNYDYEIARKNNQIEFNMYDFKLIQGTTNNYIVTESDEEIVKKYQKKGEYGYLEIPVDLIKSYNDTIEIEDIDMEEIR